MKNSTKIKATLLLTSIACAAGATAALVLLSPLLLVTAVFVRLSSKGPVIFKQERIGKDGKVFEIYKFRSMRVGAEHTGSGVYSGKGDPRVTKVGRFLRATSIDELPQLVNILAVALPDHAALADGEGRIVHNGAVDLVLEGL